MRDVAVALMARAPEPGTTKTRLIPALGAYGAAKLHAALVEHALAEIARCGAPATLWCAPDADHPFFAECARRWNVALRAQPDGDLGARMGAAFGAARGPLLLMGSDCPPIDAALLRICAGAFARAPAVFLPTVDGGYGLVGLRRPIPEIFMDMPWSTDAVMSITRDRLTRLGVHWEEPAEIWDVDTPADVERLAAAGFPIPPFED